MLPLLAGELQPWAEPHPRVQIVHKDGPMDGDVKPYGTFPAQIESLDKNGDYRILQNTPETADVLQQDQSPVAPSIAMEDDGAESKGNG